MVSYLGSCWGLHARFGDASHGAVVPVHAGRGKRITEWSRGGVDGAPRALDVYECSGCVSFVPTLMLHCGTVLRAH